MSRCVSRVHRLRRVFLALWRRRLILIGLANEVNAVHSFGYCPSFHDSFWYEAGVEKDVFVPYQVPTQN